VDDSTPPSKFFERWWAATLLGVTACCIAVVLGGLIESLAVAALLGIAFVLVPIRVTGVRLTSRVLSWFSAGFLLAAAATVVYFLATWKPSIWR
jgi:fucose 4-O-acetylase-like acetyltransferase